ncbi:MAG TPA: DUF3667 domain-containing protein [Enhygromyxa sp.]|nr:DUF3667 domain-containing protein [Enhygromyxa sp.]
MAERAMPTTCRNCGELLRGPYCSTCGQSHRFVRLELRALLEDMIDALRHVDTPVLRTVGELTVDPGRVGREYLVGRRIPYVNPFKFALVTFVLAIVVNQALIGMHGIPSDPQLARLVGFTLSWGQAIHFAVMPVFTLCLYGLFAGPPRLGGVLGAPRMLEWLEHFVLVLFALGHVALLQCLLAPFVPYLGVVAPALFVVLPILYVSWMFVGVCRTSWWSTLLRVSVAFIAGVQVPASLLARWFAPELFA